VSIKTLVGERVKFQIDSTIDLEVDKDVEDLDHLITPYNAISYRVDDYRFLNGWPVPVPKIDVRAESFVSAAGEILSHRPHPAQVTTNADVRWIPTEESWSIDEMKWRPEDTTAYPQYVWESATDFAPTYLNDYSYRIGKEIVSRSALNFSAEENEHLWSNFVGGFEGAAGFSVLAVVSLESKFGLDNTDQDFSGLICAGHPTPGDEEIFPEPITGGTANLHLRGRYLFAEVNGSGFQQMFPVNLALTSSQPSYIGFTVSPPQVKVYMGFGVPTMQVGQFNIQGDVLPNGLNLVIGRATGDILHCADMTLFDLGLYGQPLSDEEMLTEIATLSSAFGG